MVDALRHFHIQLRVLCACLCRWLIVPICQMGILIFTPDDHTESFSCHYTFGVKIVCR